jgi:hypothetical protein
MHEEIATFIKGCIFVVLEILATRIKDSDRPLPILTWPWESMRGQEKGMPTYM